MWICSQEVVSTSNSNTAVALCRLFEMLLVEPVTTHPEDKNIRIWIMVLSLYYVDFFSTCNLTETRHLLFGFNHLSESFAVLFLCFFSFLLSGSFCILPGVVCGGCLWCRQQREVQSVCKGHTFWRNTGMSNPWNSWEMGVSHGGKRPGVWLLLWGNLLLYSEGFLLVLS